MEDSKRTGEEFAAAKAALGDLAQSEEDIMSYICYPAQARSTWRAGRQPKRTRSPIPLPKRKEEPFL